MPKRREVNLGKRKQESIHFFLNVDMIYFRCFSSYLDFHSMKEPVIVKQRNIFRIAVFHQAILLQQKN